MDSFTIFNQYDTKILVYIFNFCPFPDSFVCLNFATNSIIYDFLNSFIFNIFHIRSASSIDEVLRIFHFFTYNVKISECLSCYGLIILLSINLVFSIHTAKATKTRLFIKEMLSKLFISTIET